MKDFHIHVHYHYPRKTPSSLEDIYDDFSHKIADANSAIPTQEEIYPSPRPHSCLNLPLYITRGETVLWSGEPDPIVLQKSYKRRRIVTVITLIVTSLFAIWPMSLEQAMIFWLCFGIWPISIAMALIQDVQSYKQDFYMITPTSVVFFRGNSCSEVKIKNIVSWKTYSKDNAIGTIHLKDDIPSVDNRNLYQINSFGYVKHLLLSLLAKASALKVETISGIPRLTYCPQCGYNIGKEMDSL